MLGLFMLLGLGFISPVKSYWYYYLWLMCLGTLLSLLHLWLPGMEALWLTKWVSVDSLSSSMIVLTLWVTGLMLLASQSSIKKAHNNCFLFCMTTLILTLILVTAFLVSDMVLFYFMFEASLLPTLFLILGWGYQPERLQAGMYMMLYTITASLPLILLILYLKTEFGSAKVLFVSLISNSNSLSTTSSSSSNLLFIILYLAFLVKLPMYGIHLWLPKAHVEAPVAGSMILAAILLKLGGYGMIRASQFLFLKSNMSILIAVFALWGGVLSAIICFRQVDLKAFIAYSSVGHMSFLVIGLMSWSTWGWGALLVIMVAHAFSSSGLFAIANITYESSHTRSMFLIKGMMQTWPLVSLCWFLLCSLNMACPPTINLLGEIASFPAAIFVSWMCIIPLGMMSFFATLYSMYLYLSVEHGTPSKFLNAFKLPKSWCYILILAHWLPANLLILKSNLILLWMY